MENENSKEIVFEKRGQDKHISQLKKKIDNTNKSIEEIKDFLIGTYEKKGLISDVHEIKTEAEECKESIKDHKANHWKWSTIIIACFSAITGLFIKFVK